MFCFKDLGGRDRLKCFERIRLAVEFVVTTILDNKLYLDRLGFCVLQGGYGGLT